jgi:hypothetical protein
MTVFVDKQTGQIVHSTEDKSYGAVSSFLCRFTRRAQKY